MFLIVHRGLGGLLAMLSPFLVGILLQFPLNWIFNDDGYPFRHVWSMGLVLMLAGLLTHFVAKRTAAGAIATTTTTAAIQYERGEMVPSDDEDDTRAISKHSSPDEQQRQQVQEEEEETKNVGTTGMTSSSNSHSCLETDVANEFHDNNDGPSSGQSTNATSSLYDLLHSRVERLIQQPPHPDHFCFVPMNRIALVWMILGVLLILVDVLNFLLSPVGGILGAILWTFLAAFGWFLYMTACRDASNTTYTHSRPRPETRVDASASDIVVPPGEEEASDLQALNNQKEGRNNTDTDTGTVIAESPGTRDKNVSGNCKVGNSPLEESHGIV